MARLDPREGFETLKERVIEAISSNFPREGTNHTLELEGVNIQDDLDINDITAQKKAKLQGTTFGVPVKATMILKDKTSGKVLEKKTLKVATLPKYTRRHSFIVKGSEYQVDNQWRLKPGIYTRVAQNGELQSRFNFQGKQSLDMIFDPKTKAFKIKHGGAKPPLYPILKAVGIDDDTIEAAWGKDILNANKATPKGKALNVEKLAVGFAKRLDPKATIKTMDDASDVIRDYLADSEIREDVTKLTLGKSFKRITPEVLTRSSKRLLGVARGEEKPDVRDALMFKDLLGVEDFVAERMGEGTRTIQRRISNNLDRKETIREIVGPDIFDRPIREFFSKSSLASTPEQTNPLQMLSGQQRTTITGEGGVKDAHKIMEDAKLVDPSHFGILDPLHTPEGSKTGVSLHLSTSAIKRGKSVFLPLVNVKTGKVELLEPKEINENIIAMPDEGEWEKGKWKPKSSTVKASIPGNEIREVKAKDVKYVMGNTGQVFSVATNMVPFLNSDSPNRSTMAGRHMEQAIPLVNPEAPLVQADRGNGKTYDEFVGRYASHEAPVEGTIAKIEPGAIHIKAADGKVNKIQIYDNYPLNDKKGMLNSVPKVEVGQTVKKGQLIADSNFTKDGVYAPGVNMRVGYTPWKGYNFEDGVVISDSAAEKLTSEHLYKKSLSLKEAQTVGLKKFMAYKSSTLNKDQMGKLGDDGIIKPGMKVTKGDTLIAALSEKAPTTEAQMLKNLHRSLVNPYSNRSVTWDQDVEGEVVAVSKKGKDIQVHVKTSEAMQVGDKLVGRHGNKGIVTRILPDTEMPQTEEGKALEVVMNPIGIAGRMNVGQVLETAAGKLAKKKGETYKVVNFGNDDNRTKVEEDLKKAGINDKETIIDPVNNKKVPGVLVGDQYILKLQHQVDKKMMARSRDGYDRNLIPKGGGHHGAQALGSLGIYAMLAHGAKANIREMQTLKSDKAQNDEVWAALQAGEPIPPPQTTFAYKKFESYLKGMGINVEKDGNSLNLMPLTDNQVLEMSNGRLKDAGKAVRGYKVGSKVTGRIEPEKSGLFDLKITGGLDGAKWSHITLDEPTPNPVFEKAIMSLTGIRGPQFNRLIEGKEGVKDGVVVPTGTKGATYGPQALGELLEKVDVDADLEKLEGRLGKLKNQPLNEARRKVKYLRALKSLNMSPTDAYMMRHVPVMPPAMRPLSAMTDGSLQFDDLNQLYKDVALLDQQLREQPKYAPDSSKADVRADIYDRMKALTGMGGSLKGRYKGIANIISGDSPKLGYAQDKLIKRKQDLTARSTIVPEPALSLDDIAIPRKAAAELYKPFIVREMRTSTGMGPLTAKQMLENDPDHALVQSSLQRVIDERPLLVKRDPALHKYNIQAFRPKLTEGKAIKIHPLVCSGFNADFDGDTMSAYVPMSNEAIDEARKMFPSRILFNPATARVMYSPSHEAQVGLYIKSEVGKKTNMSFKSRDELKTAVKANKLAPNDVAKVGSVKTTLDRVELDEALPTKMRGGKILTDLNYRFTKGEQNKLFGEMAKADKNGYAKNIDRMKDMGNLRATHGSFSFGLDDFKVHSSIRDPILSAAEKKAKGLNLDKKADMDKFIDIYEGAMKEMQGKLKDQAQAGRRPIDKLEVSAGIKGKGYTQLTGAPVLFVDAKGEVVPSPVKRSYSEGLRAADYWASASGGRKGVVQKVQSVSEPGYLTKLMMNSTMNTLVAEEDCGTDKGISLDIDEPDIVGRFTTSDIKVGRTMLPTNTMVTPEVVNKMRNSKVSRVLVRSPMRCNHSKGVCKKCAGLNENGELQDLGTNVGVLAAQAIGERGTQLAMKAFHSGGVFEGRTAQEKSVASKGLERAMTILHMPKIVKGSAKLSELNGTISAIDKDPAGGVNITVGDKRHYVPADRKVLTKIKKGTAVKRGDPLTSGPINPHELLPLTNMNKVQGYLASELHSIYAPEGIRRRNSEVLVRSLSNVTKVENPGDSEDFIVGDFAPTSIVNEWNKKNRKTGKQPIRHTPVLKGVKQIPLDVQTDWLARLNHENLRGTIVEAAQQGWASQLHGDHPIPPLIYGAEFGKGTKEEPWKY